MSSRDEALKAINLIHKHKDTILDAYYENNGVIPDSLENENVIRDLTRYRLAWRIDSYDDVRLSRDIKRLLDGATSSYRRRSSNAQISETFDHIKMLLDQLSDARKRNREDDRINLMHEVEESVAELIEYMRSAIGHFTHYITTGFAFTNDITLRITENERVIKMARDLNTIIEELMNENVYTLHGSNVELQKMFVNYLPQAIRACTEDLNHTLHQLRTLLHKLKESKETVQMIEAFEQRYTSDPGFEPDIDEMINTPEILNCASGLTYSGVADIYDMSQEGVLSELASDLRDNPEAEIENTLPDIKVVEDISDPHVTEENFLLEAAIAVIDDLIEGEGEMTALESYVELDIDALDVSPDMWILTLINQVHALEEDRKSKVLMSFVEEKVPMYSGLFHLHDVRLERIKLAG